MAQNKARTYGTRKQENATPAPTRGVNVNDDTAGGLQIDYHFVVMKRAAISLLLLLVSAATAQAAINQPCKAGGEAASFVRVHGRLTVYNGGYPNLRLWQIGTHHLFGIYSDPADLRCNRSGTCNEYGDEDTKLPDKLDSLMMLPNPLFEFSVYGDFKIRLLEPFQPGHMQAACIVDAQKVVRRRSN